MTVVWEVDSAGQRLRVAGPDELGRWWPGIGPQVPGTAPGPLPVAVQSAQVQLPCGVGAPDARRWINAHLHSVHLGRDTICVHGVVVAHDVGAVLLLGGHGAGKSLTGLALMTAHRWRPVAGDVALVQVGHHPDPMVVGGTRAYSMRRADLCRWFPECPLPAGGGDRVDVAGLLHYDARWSVPLVAIVGVRVDGDPAKTASFDPYDGQTARNSLYRASGHLLDRVLDDRRADPLRLLETVVPARERVRLVRQLADDLACGSMQGNPFQLAAAITELATAEATT